MTLRRCCALVALIFVAGAGTVEAQCTATVTPTTVSVPSNGSTSAVSVITGGSCLWTATSSVDWITVTFATGSGLGQVQYTVAPNTGTAARTGTLIVAGHTVTFTQAANSCVYTVTPTSFTVPPNGNIFTLSVTSGTTCSWTATTTDTWITITAGSTGSGIGAVSFTVPATTASRTGALLVAGRTVTITQDGQPSPAPPTNLQIIR
jgi:hypothetical protein